jgi:hypothetical protein
MFQEAGAFVTSTCGEVDTVVNFFMEVLTESRIFKFNSISNEQKDHDEKEQMIKDMASLMIK